MNDPYDAADQLENLSAVDRSWIRYWQKRRAENFEPLEGRPDVHDWRAHCASLLREKAPKAWKLIKDAGL